MLGRITPLQHGLFPIIALPVLWTVTEFYLTNIMLYLMLENKHSPWS